MSEFFAYLPVSFIREGEIRPILIYACICQSVVNARGRVGLLLFYCANGRAILHGVITKIV